MLNYNLLPTASKAVGFLYNKIFNFFSIFSGSMLRLLELPRYNKANTEEFSVLSNEFKYKRVLLKLSGEVLAGKDGFGINPGTRTYDLVLNQYRNLLHSNLMAIIKPEKDWLEEYKKYV